MRGVQQIKHGTCSEQVQENPRSRHALEERFEAALRQELARKNAPATRTAAPEADQYQSQATQSAKKEHTYEP